MTTQQNKLPAVLGWMNMGLGVVFFLAYWVYLPMPELFQSVHQPDPGMVLYALATAGSALVAWGLLLRGLKNDAISRRSLYIASAIGFALLGFMRLGTAIFPHAPFDQLRAVPVVECIVFSLLALRLFKTA